MIITILIFLLMLGVLVFVHEFGHFIVARKSGMKVDEFGFGFPPRLAGIQKVHGKWKLVWGMKAPLDPQETVYSINLIPLGGFVKILGENNEEATNPRSFINRHFWGRFFTLIAGVVMNALLAWALLSVGFMIKLPTEIDNPQQPPAHAIMENPRIIIEEVVANNPAAKAGLLAGDTIESIDGVQYTNQSDVVDYIRSHDGQQIDFQVKRVDKTLDVLVTPEASQENGGQGFVGAGLAQIADLHYPWYYALQQGAIATFYGFLNVVVGLYGLISGHVSFSNVGGPIAIAKLTGQAAKLGFMSLLQLTAFLSINLALLNILPFPALDGGRVLFLIIEKIRGKRNNQTIEQWVNTVGFVFLLLLMVVVTIKDIVVK